MRGRRGEYNYTVNVGDCTEGNSGNKLRGVLKDGELMT